MSQNQLKKHVEKIGYNLYPIFSYICTTGLSTDNYSRGGK
jgi:hypothetical protein